MFKTGSRIDEASAPSQLFQCAGVDLGFIGPSPTMRSLAVIPVATCVLHTELLQLHQEREKTFWAFAARVQGKAETCALNARCKCGKSVDYTDHMIRDVLLNGLSDHDIREDILGMKDILTKAISDIITFVETKEMARNDLPSATLSSSLTFKQITQAQPMTLSPVPTPSDSDRVSTCPDCKASFKMFTEGTRGWTPSHTRCVLTATEHEIIAAFQATETPSDNGDRDGSPPTHGSFSRTLSHYIFTKGE